MVSISLFLLGIAFVCIICRYAPYPIPAGAAAAHAAAHASHAHAHAAQNAAPPQSAHAHAQPQAQAGHPHQQALAAATAQAPVAAHNPYQAYGLPNVDMSSFQGVDWSSMYGMGMYV